MMSNGIDSLEFHDALKSIRAAKCWLMVIIFLSLGAQLAGFVLVDMFPIVDQRALTGEAGGAEIEDDKVVADVINWALAASKFAALAAAGMLSLVVMFAVKLSLLGRIGGPAGFLGAFFWSLILLVVVFPWQGALDSAVACGATFNLGQLTAMAQDARESWGAENPALVKQTFYYARFLGYPVLAVLITLVVMVRFGRGYRPLKKQVATVVTPAPMESVDPMEDGPL